MIEQVMMMYEETDTVSVNCHIEPSLWFEPTRSTHIDVLLTRIGESHIAAAVSSWLPDRSFYSTIPNELGCILALFGLRTRDLRSLGVRE